MKRIVIADDSAFMRILLRKTFDAIGCEVVGEAENGKVAVEKYKELHPDMITLDITMQEMNGIEALRKIIEYDKNAIAIMISAMGQAIFVEEAVVAGAKGFLIKPFKEPAIVALVEKLLR